MYELNICSPIWDDYPDGTLNVRVTRTLFGVNVFLLCILYNFISFFLKRKIKILKLQDKQINIPKVDYLQKFYQVSSLFKLLRNGDHIVSIGFVMLYSPYQFQVALSIIYVLTKIFYQIKLHKWRVNMKFCKKVFRIINLSLLICAMIGLSRTGYDSNGNCYDKSYQIS